MSQQADPRSAIDAAAATEMLSAATATPYALVGDLVGGETGATEIRRADGKRFVLKWDEDDSSQARRRLGAQLAERLRTEAGWPAPVQELLDIDGTLLIVQEFMPGSNVEHLSHDIVDRVLELHHARLGLTVADSGEWGQWSSYLLRTLTHGAGGYCLHEPLRTFDARTRTVIERVEEIGRSTDPCDLAGCDIIHFDLHPGNLLHADGHLSAVVDMDYVRIGDAEFDLTTLAIASLGAGADPGVRERLFGHGIEALPSSKRDTYIAHLLLRNLDWAIRKSRRSDIEFWLSQTERLMPA